MAKNKTDNEKLNNSLTGLVQGIANTSMINQQIPAIVNNRYSLVSNNRVLLNELYVEHGLIQTLVDAPVDDAFRGGFSVKSDGQLDEDNIADILQFMETEDITSKIVQVMKWARLFGGGGLVAMTNQDPEKELNIERISEFSSLDFYAADLWELNMQYYNQNQAKEMDIENPYQFYGKNLHKSMVYAVKGKEAPSLVRPKFRGWGMSEVERMMRSFNQYTKNNNVIFELLDEAKIDIYKIDGFNNSLTSQGGTIGIQNRVQSANEIKNYLNALTMDTKDEYEQKQMNFAGLGDMLSQVRMGIASDLKMPITKLFGVSSAGFNSGEDDIENYNAMVESEVRAKSKHIIIHVVKMVSAKLFGFVPDDVEIEFPPLRVLSAEQEETVKDKKMNRLLLAFQTGVITTEEVQESINADNLIPVKVDVTGEANPINVETKGMPREDIV